MKKKYFGIICWGMLLSSFVQAQEYNSAEVYQSAFNLVQEKYIHYQPEDIENMAINGLKALHNIDKNLSVADDEKRMSLYYKGRVVRSHLKPENRQNIEAWNKLTENMIKAAQNVSSRAKQNDFMILDTIMEEAVNQSLDGVSKYYPEGQSEAVVKSGAAKSFAAGLQDNILYIKISAFNDYTIKNLEKTWQENPNYEGIILDLRGSVGGELSEAMKVADMFLSGGTFVSPSGNGMDYDYSNNNGWGSRSFIDKFSDSQFRESLGEYTYNDVQSTTGTETANVKPKKKRVIVYTLVD